MPAGRLTRTVLALALVLAAAGCRSVSVQGQQAPCARVQTERQVRGDALCEDTFLCARPPIGRFDRVGLRRLARCDGAAGPVVLYLPGMYQNAEMPQIDARYDLRMHLALAGVRTWGIDYRTHQVPATATAADLAVVAGWGAEVFGADADWAVGFVRTADPGPLYVAGFSYGAGLAYRLAARSSQLAGLVILDGVPPGEMPAPEGSGPVLDAGGGRLPWSARERLLAAVLVDPNGPSPVPGFATAESALADIVYTAPSFGGHGGLSAAKDGMTDVVPLARLLATYDRWWPSAALAGGRSAARSIPVLAFASQNMGPAWVDRVRAGAKAFGGEKAPVHVLPRQGHLDVLVGKQAARLVFEPVLNWVTTAH